MEFKIAEEPKSHSKLHDDYLILFGAFCLHLFCGNLYLWGNIANYVISYFHYPHKGMPNGDPNATLAIAVLVLPVTFSI